MPNLTNTDYKKMNIDKSFKTYKRHNVEAIYKIKFDNENTYHGSCIITKILKLDKATSMVTLWYPTVCTKEHPYPS